MDVGKAKDAAWRLVAIIGRGSLSVLTAVLIAVPVLLIALAIFHGTIIDLIYKNVTDPNDGEMPVTVTSYPSAPEIVGIIGGSGEGLNCSLTPRGIDVLFDGSADEKGKRHLVRQRFRQACVFHDFCYRHGLATYGYTQSDCDRILQNQAYRICLYIPNSAKSPERCQHDAKKLLAGVSIGGWGSYRGWDRSTFFEFDGDPVRSSEFRFSRIVDHPFKTLDPDKYQNEPDQVVLSFLNRRQFLTLRCVNCGRHSILPPSTNPASITDEFRAVGLQTRPEALLDRERLFLNRLETVWLPPGANHAGPQLVEGPSGDHQLVWLSRTSQETTGACMVTGDARRLLTYTLPKASACHRSAGSRLGLADLEMFSSSPLPMLLSDSGGGPDRLFATGLTVQRGPRQDLHFCGWSEAARGSRAECRLLKWNDSAVGKEMGAFQNSVTVRKDQQIIIARGVAASPTSSDLRVFVNRVVGDRYSPEGSFMAIDVTADQNGKLADAKVRKRTEFNIDDRFDPLVPVSKRKDDYRFLSLLTSKSRVGLYVTDFADNAPRPSELETLMDGAKLDLHPSWVRRAVLVAETKGAEPKTQVIFSRARILDREAGITDSLRLETLLFERAASAPKHAPFALARSASCHVRYTFDEEDSDRMCRRRFVVSRPMRPSPAALMSASQLLTGRVTASKDLALVFADACLTESPIMLEPWETRSFSVTKREVEERGVTREVTCGPLTSRQDIAEELPGVGETSTGQ